LVAELMLDEEDSGAGERLRALLRLHPQVEQRHAVRQRLVGREELRVDDSDGAHCRWRDVGTRPEPAAVPTLAATVSEGQAGRAPSPGAHERRPVAVQCLRIAGCFVCQRNCTLMRWRLSIGGWLHPFARAVTAPRWEAPSGAAGSASGGGASFAAPGRPRCGAPSRSAVVHRSATPAV